MLPLRIVFDTNCVVSAALSGAGLQRAALTLALTRPARLHVSAPVLAEYGEVLSRAELQIRKATRLQLMQTIKNRAHLVQPKRMLNVCVDADDNIFLECAEAARADYLVTGNLKHFPAFWKSTKVVSGRQFVDLVAPHLLG